MTNDWRRAASDWAVAALEEVAVSGFAQIDLDTLTGVSLDPLLAVDVMRVALKTATKVDASVQGMVVLPLEPSEVRRRDSPEWPSLLHSFEDLRGALAVPGIYLIAAGHPLADGGVEEYTAPVPIPREVGPSISGFYREWRTSQDQALDWEYNRAIYLTAVS